MRIGFSVYVLVPQLFNVGRVSWVWQEDQLHFGKCSCRVCSWRWITAACTWGGDAATTAAAVVRVGGLPTFLASGLGRTRIITFTVVRGGIPSVMSFDIPIGCGRKAHTRARMNMIEGHAIHLGNMHTPTPRTHTCTHIHGREIKR